MSSAVSQQISDDFSHLCKWKVDVIDEQSWKAVTRNVEGQEAGMMEIS
jgi:hypothetical protein